MDYLDKLRALMKQNDLTEYALSMKSGVPQSTINSLFRKNNLPTFSTLEALLKPMHVSMSEFFYDGSSNQNHDIEQQELLRKWQLLSSKEKETIQTLIDLLIHSK